MWLRRPIAIAIELLAGIPSIIYGIWGLFVFAPFLQKYVQPFLIDAVRQRAGAATLFEGPPYGIGMLTAGLILAIMVLPFITSISRDVFDAVPPVLKEAAYGVGCTTWEVFAQRRPALHARRRDRRRHAGPGPRARRDHGGHLRDRQRAPHLRLDPGAGHHHLGPIANEFTEAVGDLYTSSLIALGLILFVITFIVLAFARYMLMRLSADRDDHGQLAHPLYAGRRRRNAIADGAVACRDGVRPGLAGADPGRAALGGLRRPLARGVHRDHAAARRRRRPAERHRRQPDHDRRWRSLIGTPIGILAGTYLAEYGRYDRLTSVVRFINDILLSAPSIVVGLFVYEIMVAPMGHFSGWAGAVALAVIVIPVVVRTTEDMLHPGARHAARGRRLDRPAALAHDPRRSPIAPRAPASSPASCWRSPASAARPRRSCSPRSTTSSGART